MLRLLSGLIRVYVSGRTCVVGIVSGCMGSWLWEWVSEWVGHLHEHWLYSAVIWEKGLSEMFDNVDFYVGKLSFLVELILHEVMYGHITSQNHVLNF